MKPWATAVIGACLVFGAGVAAVLDTDKPDPPAEPRQMTAQQCKQHLAIAKNDDTVRDPALLNKDAQCAELKSKQAVPSGTASGPRPAKH
jgi:hypothetical protein